jgi:FkbH-like protein
VTDTFMHFGWLPEEPDWATRLEQARNLEPVAALRAFARLANCRIDFIQTTRLDRAAQQLARYPTALASMTGSVRLALLGSSTLTHLIAGIRVGALRRGIWVDVYEGPYGMYRQELQDPTSGLHAFKPDVLLLSLDAHHLVGAEGATVEHALSAMSECWQLAKQTLGCTVIQQAILPVFRPILGNNEHRYPRSPLTRVTKLNESLRTLADEQGTHVLAVDTVAARDGIAEWHDEGLWHRSKQEIHPRVLDVYGDEVARLLAAIRGRSYKCLVLDLDNTLWGGVIGDDGLAGIVIGQGTGVGEAHLAFQRYALELSQRGVLLAVCSKNDEASALEAFDRHPEMLLRREQISCFVANWEDKASNLRQIAQRLNISTDSLVFADDNPFERNLIRQELPEVAVPELPEDPAGFAACVAAAGYFEGLSITNEDQERVNQYRANAEREQLRESTTDMPAYLQSLRMELHCSPFDPIGLPRIVQLINKTNQYNLMTRRYTDTEVQAVMVDPSALHLQFRLQDRFGDNGVIALVIGKLDAERKLVIDTWLMSCRVLGREVESATLNVVARRAAAMGATDLIGSFRPTPKNEMVRDHYPKLGFDDLGKQGGETRWALPLDRFRAAPVSMAIFEGSP